MQKLFFHINCCAFWLAIHESMVQERAWRLLAESCDPLLAAYCQLSQMDSGWSQSSLHGAGEQNTVKSLGWPGGSWWGTAGTGTARRIRTSLTYWQQTNCCPNLRLPQISMKCSKHIQNQIKMDNYHSGISGGNYSISTKVQWNLAIAVIDKPDIQRCFYS